VREQSKAAGHVAAMMDQVNDGLTAIRQATEEQSRGHEAVVDGTRRMSEVAEQLRTTTEEQARGVRRIGESAEGVREASESIHALVEAQTSACATSAELLQQLASQTAVSEESASQMEEAIRGLVDDSHALRTDVARFQL
jgi:methyl-accepting chemotaxis protein